MNWAAAESFCAFDAIPRCSAAKWQRARANQSSWAAGARPRLEFWIISTSDDCVTTTLLKQPPLYAESAIRKTRL